MNCNKKSVINKHIIDQTGKIWTSFQILLFEFQREKTISIFHVKYGKVVPLSWLIKEPDDPKTKHVRAMEISEKVIVNKLK